MITTTDTTMDAVLAARIKESRAQTLACMVAGFYKDNRENVVVNASLPYYQAVLLYAPTAVSAPTYTLHKDDRLTYIYPVEGWHWFDTLIEANTFFDIKD